MSTRRRAAAAANGAPPTSSTSSTSSSSSPSSPSSPSSSSSSYPRSSTTNDTLSKASSAKKQLLQQHNQSPMMPTTLELILLSIYPLTLILGSAFSLVAPHVRSSASTYSPQHQSFQPAATAPSYFAQKRNVFNIYFVKQGWLWTTTALFLFALTHPSLGPLPPWSHSLRVVTAARIRLALRWAVATLVWFGTTQWFFGPALIDRSFRWTGGACQVLRDAEKMERMSEVREIFTHAACKLAGGTWSGGIDISGHVFLLILGSALLWMEMLPTVLRAGGLREERRVRLADGRVVSAMVEGGGRADDDANTPSYSSSSTKGEEEGEVTKLGVKVAVAVVALSWWMLLMTAAFFHTWSEKLTGLIVAFFGVWLIYFLPRGVPIVRSVLGMPGL